MGQMNDEKTRSTGAWGVGAVVILPLVYVLSVGPVAAFVEHYHVSYLRSSLAKFYAPVEWLYDHTPLKGPFDSYLSLWGLK